MARLHDLEKIKGNLSNNEDEMQEIIINVGQKTEKLNESINLFLF